MKFDLHTRIAPRKAVCGLISKNGMPQLVARNNSLTFGRGLYLKGLLSRKISVFKRGSRAWIQTECISRTRIPPRFNLPWLISVDGICSTFVAWSHRSMVDIMTGNKFQLKNDVNLPPLQAVRLFFSYGEHCSSVRSFRQTFDRAEAKSQSVGWLFWANHRLQDVFFQPVYPH